MTQENDNSTSAGAQTPEKAKPKKTTARKASATKSSTAKPAATTATAPEKTAAKTVSPEKAAAPKEKKAAPKRSAAAKKTAATKKAVKEPAAPETAPKVSAAEKTDAKEAKTSKAAAPKEKKPAMQTRPEPAKTAKAPDSETGAKEKTPAKPRSARSAKAAVKKPAAKAAEQKSAEREQAPAPLQELSPALPPEQPQEQPPSQTKEQPREQTQELSQEQPRSSSRRSRRGGRRRNKKPAQPAMDGAVAEKEEKAPELAVIDAANGAPEGKNAEEAAIPEKAATKEHAAQESVAKEKASPKETPSAKNAAPPKAKSAKASAAKAEIEPAKSSSGKRKMFISVLSGELVEVVLAEEGLVQEYYVEMQHQAKVKGNIYKGVVSNIDANLQAAFISYAGGVKNGFLQIDEVHPEYYSAHHAPAKGRKYPPIQKVLKPGQEILVQVVKEPAGTKGAFLTSYLSLPGRFLVLTPGREQIGVSRKVESDAERARLRGILDGLSLGSGLGVIVRTVSSSASKTSLTRDLQFLKRLWKEVRAKGQAQPSPSLVYEELDLSTRAVRDYLTDDVQEVWVDDEQTAKQVAELASLLFPKKQNLVQVHRETGHSLFERFSLQKQLDQIHSREASLPSGGRLVIDNTEALTAIDINSGRSSGKTNFEDMAFRTNLEAAKAIPSHLRLRDIGGQIVVDFIEMRDRDHWREVEKTIRNGMKGDRARYDVGKIGPFGMLEIVRQRLGSSAISVSTEPCPCCKGTGIRRNMEWQAMQSLRDMGRALRAAAANNQTNLTYPVETELAFYLLNTKRSILQKMEEESGVAVIIRPPVE